MKAFGTPVKIAVLEFYHVFCKWRCGVNMEQAVRACEQGRDGTAVKWFYGHGGLF